MAKTAIFIGAGASKPFGFPLTNELLPKIREHIDNNQLFNGFDNSRQDRENLKNMLNQLIPGWNSVEPEHLPLITDILSIVDYSLLVSTSPLRSKEGHNLSEFRTLLEKAVFEILECPYDNNIGPIPPSLVKMSDWVHDLATTDGNSTGIISTNYDISIETELFKRYGKSDVPRQFDFGFAWRDPGKDQIHPRPTPADMCLYKLHGSMNWLRCDLCEHVYINLGGSIAHQGFEPTVTDFNTCDCNHSRLRPVLVAPSMVRDIRDINLLETWKHALELLRTADEWIIIGYSMPSEDIAIRSLFIRARQGRKTEPQIRVVQKGNDPAMRARYRVYFPECEFHADGLEGFLTGDLNVIWGATQKS